MIFSNLIIGLLWVFSGVHPFHVSITELIYKEESKSVQIMHKVFVDDFEQTLNKHYHVQLDILSMHSTEGIDGMVSDYFSKRFKVEIDGKATEVVYIGSELEENVLWVYQEIYKVKRPKTFQITHTVLFDEFDDQSNLVHTSINGKIKTIRLTVNDTSKQLIFK